MRMMQLKVTAGLFPMIAIEGCVVCLIFHSFVVQQTMTILCPQFQEILSLKKKCNFKKASPLRLNNCLFCRKSSVDVNKKKEKLPFAWNLMQCNVKLMIIM